MFLRRRNERQKALFCASDQRACTSRLPWATGTMEAVVLNTFAYGTFYHRPSKSVCTATACKHNENLNAFGTSTTEPSTEHYPVPVSSEFGGVLSVSHTVLFSSHRSSSAPSSSQSWSPLHTRDLLMHWPKSEQKCMGKEVFVHLKINHLNSKQKPHLSTTLISLFTPTMNSLCPGGLVK